MKSQPRAKSTVEKSLEIANSLEAFAIWNCIGVAPIEQPEKTRFISPAWLLSSRSYEPFRINHFRYCDYWQHAVVRTSCSGSRRTSEASWFNTRSEDRAGRRGRSSSPDAEPGLIEMER